MTTQIDIFGNDQDWTMPALLVVLMTILDDARHRGQRRGGLTSLAPRTQRPRPGRCPGPGPPCSRGQIRSIEPGSARRGRSPRSSPRLPTTER